MSSIDATRIRSFVQNLDQNDRYLVLLHYADGLTEMEVAAVLRMKTADVQARLGELRDAMHGFISRPTIAPRPRQGVGAEAQDAQPMFFA